MLPWTVHAPRAQCWRNLRAQAADESVSDEELSSGFALADLAAQVTQARTGVHRARAL